MVPNETSVEFNLYNKQHIPHTTFKIFKNSIKYVDYSQVPTQRPNHRKKFKQNSFHKKIPSYPNMSSVNSSLILEKKIPKQKNKKKIS